MYAILLTISLLLAGPQTSGEGRYGQVEFANSGSPSAQADFLKGLALLHDFEYPAAAAAFRRAEAKDPGFAMAYWGEAMTFNHPIWMQQDLQAARTALNKLATTPAARREKAKTDREKQYFDTVEILYGEGTKEERDFRYEAAIAQLHARYPDDVDAVAFHGLAILGTAHAGRDIPTYMRAAGMLEEAWSNHRDHPGLIHYLIHSYDDPVHAPLGLRAARIYSKIAPDAGHAQHMTSHIFLALGMWREVVEANIAAMADVARARQAAGKGPATCGHYPSWLAYGYLQLGQLDKAMSAIAACRASVESQAAMDHPGMSMDPDDSMAGALANMRLRYLLESGDWTGPMAAWSLPKNAGAGARLDFGFARALGEITQGHRDAAHRSLAEFEIVSKEVVDLMTKSGNPDPTYRIRPEIMMLEARALLAEKEGNLDVAQRLLLQAAGLEDKLPIAFGPPTIDKPTHELLGEFLLRHGRNPEARLEFQKAISLAPGRRIAQRGLESSATPPNPK